MVDSAVTEQGLAKPADARAAAVRRFSRWIHNSCFVAALLFGVIGILVAVVSRIQSLSMPDAPTIGAKFTEAASTFFGGLVVGAMFEAVALLALVVALLHSSRRLRTLWAAVPAIVYVIGFLAWQRGWLP
jgi:hypothetical protein